MASITIDNLQPMMEYEELSGAELESVIGGIVTLAAQVGIAIGTASLVVGSGAAIIAGIAAGGR
jgi:hypothetical protein